VSQVFEESVELKDSHYFDIPNNLYYVADPGYPTDSHVIDGIVERARGRIGENRYGITYNNCEHFVRYFTQQHALCLSVCLTNY